MKEKITDINLDLLMDWRQCQCMALIKPKWIKFVHGEKQYSAFMCKRCGRSVPGYSPKAIGGTKQVIIDGAKFKSY